MLKMIKTKGNWCALLSFVMAFSATACGGSPSNSGKEEGNITDNFVNYIDPEQAKYEFGFKEMVTPYYLGNVIYNETVLLEDDGTNISGKLLKDGIFDRGLLLLRQRIDSEARIEFALSYDRKFEGERNPRTL